MAIYKALAAMLLEESKKRPFSGRILQLGRQDIWLSMRDLRPLLAKYGHVPPNTVELEKIDDRRMLSDDEFFRALGFSSVHSLDLSDFSGASILYDLNNRDLPKNQVHRYDCVIDGGTMEHIFNIPNVLCNIHNLLCEGGRVIHINPASNSVDHGFFSFSPCFYVEYYGVNGYKVNSCKLLNLGTRLRRIRVTSYEFLPPPPRNLVDGWLGAQIHHNFFVATKLESATCEGVPQQGVYVNMWDESEGKTQNQFVQLSGESTPTGSDTPLARIKGWLRRHPLLDYRVRRLATPYLRIFCLVQARKALRSRAHRY